MAKVAKEDVEVLSPEVVEEINHKIEYSLIKENVTDKVIARLREEYMPLTIAGQDDKEGYLRVQEARKSCKSLRVLAKKICTAGRAEANAISQAWIAKEKEVIAEISEVEDHLETMEKAYEAEKERQKAEKAAKIEQQAARRIADLVRLGASLDRLNWVLGPVCYESALIREVDDDVYQGMYAEYEAEYSIKEKERLAEEKRKEEEAAELRRQQEKLEADRKVLEQQQADFQRQQQEEQDRKNKEVRDKAAAQMKARAEQLHNLGLRFDFVDHYKGYDCFVPVLDIQCHNDEQWAKLIAEITPVIERKKKEAEKEAEEKRQQELETARLEGIGKTRRSMLEAVRSGTDASDKELGEMLQSTWDANYAKAKSIYDADQKKLADKAEADRQELLGEKQKYEELVSYLKATKFPTFKSGQYRAKANIIRDFIDGLK